MLAAAIYTPTMAAVIAVLAHAKSDNPNSASSNVPVASSPWDGISCSHYIIVLFHTTTKMGLVFVTRCAEGDSALYTV